MTHREHDLPFTDKHVFLKGLVAGSLFFISLFMGSLPVQAISLVIAVFITLDTCIPYGAYFYFGTVFISIALGFLFAALVFIYSSLLLPYWLLLMASLIVLVYTGHFPRLHKKAARIKD